MLTIDARFLARLALTAAVAASTVGTPQAQAAQVTDDVTERLAQQAPPATIPTEPRAPRVIVRPQGQPAAKTRTLPQTDLTQQLLFKLLVGEIAQQRGQTAVAVQAYLDVARETKDPRIAQRATEIAWNARMSAAALEAASIWLQAEPESPQARQVLAALLVNQPKIAEAQPHLEKWLAADPAAAGQTFLQIGALAVRNQDRAAALQLVQSLARPYPQLPEAHFAVAQVAAAANDDALALTESREALRLKPDWEQAALLHAQVLQKKSGAEATAFLKGFLAKNPRAMDARLVYARQLVGEKQYEDARKEFQSLLAEFPTNADVAMAVALLSLQLQDFDAAESQLKQALDNNYKDPDAVRFYLGQISEDRKRYDDALKWYTLVSAGEQFIPARARYAGVLVKQGKVAEARKYLQETGAAYPQNRVQFVQIEAQLLRDTGDYRGAYDVLADALAKSPASLDLMYDTAMAAEKVDRLDVMETNIRKLIQLKPDHAHAYNALGYSLADRNIRLDEARTLLDQALKLAPDDPFIIDSMGWVLFRQGDLDGARKQLERAYQLRPDGEIAAHLGEVLWVQGQQDAARKLWADALKKEPSHEGLQSTIKRLAR
ncbi:MAG: tetratricopeptide repeat protein [Burkholderiales bacterium]